MKIVRYGELVLLTIKVKAELKKSGEELQAALLERELGVNESNQVILDLRVTIPKLYLTT